MSSRHFGSDKVTRILAFFHPQQVTSATKCVAGVKNSNDQFFRGEETKHGKIIG
jgi:hypothetical protein